MKIKKPFIEILKSKFEGVPDNYIFRIGGMSVKVTGGGSNEVTIICYWTAAPSNGGGAVVWADDYCDADGVMKNFNISQGFNGAVLNPSELEAACEWVDEQRVKFAESLLDNGEVEQEIREKRTEV